MVLPRFMRRAVPLAIALVVGVAFALFDWFQEEREWHDWFGYKLELRLLDQMFQQRGQLQTDSKVVIAAIDERSIDTFGIWGSWDRRVFGRAIEKLMQAGADCVAFDVVFSDEAGQAASATGRRLQKVVRAADLEGSVEGLGKALQEAEASSATVREGVTRARVEGPALKNLPAAARSRHREGTVTAIAALGDLQEHLDAARASGDKISKAAEDLVEAIGEEASGENPDETMAAAIEESSSKVILGYVALPDPSDEALVSAAAESFKRVSATAMELIAVGWGLSSEGESEAVPTYDDKIVIDDALKVPDVRGGFVVPLQIFADAGENYGYFSLDPDSDGIFRKVPLVYQYEKNLIPSLTLSTVSTLLESAAYPMHNRIYPNAIESVSFSVPQEVVERMCRMRVGDDAARITACATGYGAQRIADSTVVDVPTMASGYMLINYYGPENTTFKRVSFSDVVAGSFDPAVVRGKVVIVAATAIATHDQRVTPFDSFVPGVEVHAAAIQNIIDGKHLVRPPTTVPIEMVGMLAVAVFLGLLLRRLNIAWGIIVTVVLLVGYWAVNTFVLFRNGTWFHMVLPFTQVMLTWASITVYGYLTEGRAKLRIKEQFGNFVAPAYVEELVANPDMIGLSGEERELTVLFSDIRGFTTISEGLSPNELTKFLNEYLTPMTEVLMSHDGTLDKYIGDALMAFFGAPKWFEHHARAGCLTAVQMMERLQPLKEMWRQRSMPEIDIGIGLNSGKMRVGQMGSERMKNYTILGDNVNLGSRLEGINKEYGTNIVASEATYRAAGDAIFGRELDFVTVKGKHEPIRIFEVMGGGAPADWQQQLITSFEQGLALYRAQDWDGAVEQFRVCMKLKTDAVQLPDRTSHRYLERVKLLREAPPGEGWDGVWKMTTK